MPLYYQNSSSMLLMLIGFIISLASQLYIKAVFKKYSEVGNKNNLSGLEVARRILDSNNLGDINIFQVRGSLTDHYNPTNKTLGLSESVYGLRSIAAVAVAAHECGHAIQHEKGYIPLKIRSALVPVVQISSSSSWYLILIGMIMSIPKLVDIGILLFVATLVFQIVTLPVEFDASRRAIVKLEEYGLIDQEEVNSCRSVLIAAALTYVAAVAVSMLNLLRLLGLRNRNDR